MEECKLMTILVYPRIKLEISSHSQLVDTIEYRKLISSLFYFTIFKLDISYAVNLMERFMHKPYVEDLNVAKTILRYIMGIKNLDLNFTKFPSFIHSGFSKFDYGGDRDDKKFTSYVFNIGSSVISWYSNK